MLSKEAGIASQNTDKELTRRCQFFPSFSALTDEKARPTDGGSLMMKGLSSPELQNADAGRDDESVKRRAFLPELDLRLRKGAS